MTGIDYIQIVARNLQKESVSLVTAQVLFSILRGHDLCGDIIRHTGLTPSVVSAMLSSLVKRDLIEREGKKPYMYQVTAQGEKLVRALLAKTIA